MRPLLFSSLLFSWPAYTQSLEQFPDESIVGAQSPGGLARERIVESIDNGDGTFSLRPVSQALPALGALVDDGPIVWRYVGQARYDIHGSSPNSGLVSYIARPEHEEDPLSLLTRLEKTDYQGRVWQVAFVDEFAWQEAIEAYENAHPEPEDYPGDGSIQGDLTESPPVGTAVQFEPMSWVSYGCAVDTSFDGLADTTVNMHLWNGESRGPIGTAHNNQEKGAVQVVGDTLANSLFSGTMVEDSHVLTAAHCVSDAKNNALPTVTMRVCRDRLPACVSGTFSIDSVLIPTTYTGGTSQCCGTDFADDWAIIKLGLPIVPSSDVLTLSGASDTTINSLTTTRTFGIPAAFEATPPPGCVDNFAARTMMRNVESGGPTSTTQKKVRTRQESTPGQSGSPIYYCPAGDDSVCAFGDPGFVYGVHSGYNSFNKRVVGPKVSSFRTTAIAFMATSPQ